MAGHAVHWEQRPSAAVKQRPAMPTGARRLSLPIHKPPAAGLPNNPACPSRIAPVKNQALHARVPLQQRRQHAARAAANVGHCGGGVLAPNILLSTSKGGRAKADGRCAGWCAPLLTPVVPAASSARNGTQGMQRLPCRRPMQKCFLSERTPREWAGAGRQSWRSWRDQSAPEPRRSRASTACGGAEREPGQPGRTHAGQRVQGHRLAARAAKPP